jgi:hypothetical protein
MHRETICMAKKKSPSKRLERIAFSSALATGNAIPRNRRHA